MSPTYTLKTSTGRKLPETAPRATYDTWYAGSTAGRYCRVALKYQITGAVQPRYLLGVFSDPHMIFCACSMQNGPHVPKEGGPHELLRN
jgi:hypothetical protein